MSFLDSLFSPGRWFSAGVELVSRSKINLLAPLKGTDNTGTGRTDVSLDVAELFGGPIVRGKDEITFASLMSVDTRIADRHLVVGEANQTAQLVFTGCVDGHGGYVVIEVDGTARTITVSPDAEFVDRMEFSDDDFDGAVDQPPSITVPANDLLWIWYEVVELNGLTTLSISRRPFATQASG